MTSSALLLNLAADGLALGCIYALLAAGFSLLWWVSGIVHLAHGGVMLAAGFLLFGGIASAGLPLSAALVLAATGAIAAGLAVELLIYRPLIERRTDEMGLLTASLGTLIVLEYALTIAFGPEGVTLDAGDMRSPLLPGVLTSLDRFSGLILAVTAGLFAALAGLMSATSAGRKMRAVAANPELARILGIAIGRTYRTTAALAAALSVPAAAVLLFSTGIVPSEALHIVLVSAVVAIMGGRGSLLGALIAGLVIGVTESVMTFYLASGWRQLITFVFLYILLLARPQGLFGKPA